MPSAVMIRSARVHRPDRSLKGSGARPVEPAGYYCDHLSRPKNISVTCIFHSAILRLHAMNSLKIGISGVRGVVGETLTPELVVGFAQAFGTYLDPGRILVCRDTRSSGPMVRAAVLA